MELAPCLAQLLHPTCTELLAFHIVHRYKHIYSKVKLPSGIIHWILENITSFICMGAKVPLSKFMLGLVFDIFRASKSFLLCQFCSLCSTLALLQFMLCSSVLA